MTLINIPSVPFSVLPSTGLVVTDTDVPENAKIQACIKTNHVKGYGYQDASKPIVILV